jgi:N-glycosylase/DNA lyase
MEQLKDHFRTYIAIDKELARLTERRSQLKGQQVASMDAIREYLENTETPAVEFEGYLAEQRSRAVKVKGEKKEQRVQQAVDYVRQNQNATGTSQRLDPRSMVEEITRRLAGNRENRTVVRISKQKKKN